MFNISRNVTLFLILTQMCSLHCLSPGAPLCRNWKHHRPTSQINAPGLWHTTWPLVQAHTCRSVALVGPSAVIFFPPGPVQPLHACFAWASFQLWSVLSGSHLVKVCPGRWLKVMGWILLESDISLSSAITGCTFQCWPYRWRVLCSAPLLFTDLEGGPGTFSACCFFLPFLQSWLIIN